MNVRLISVLWSLGWLLAALPGVQAAPPAGRERVPETAAVQRTVLPGEGEQRLQARVAGLGAADDETVIYSADGYIYIRTPKRQETKVFTILGQMVFAGYAGPGLTEIQMQPRGIYIVKVGTVTQRVAL